MIGERIAEERKRLGMSQADFAKAIGVSLSSQKRYEKGEISPSVTYLTAAKKQGVNVSYLIEPTSEEIYHAVCLRAYEKAKKHSVYSPEADKNYRDLQTPTDLDGPLLLALLEGLEATLQSKVVALAPAKKAQMVVMLYRAFKAVGKIDQKMIEEAIALAGM
jgi:transcriptional regulator with XRE-family HTH domain